MSCQVAVCIGADLVSPQLDMAIDRLQGVKRDEVRANVCDHA